VNVEYEASSWDLTKRLLGYMRPFLPFLFGIVITAFGRHGVFALLSPLRARSVDPYTEALIQNALREEMVNRTVLLVTHRVSTVRDADRIVILNEGRNEDVGSHNELIERNELYRRLCELQLVAIG
jgi:hypothetical protein